MRSGSQDWLPCSVKAEALALTTMLSVTLDDQEEHAMTNVPKRVGALAVVATAAIGLAACSSTNSGGGKVSTATSSETPQAGGTLNIVANSGPDHMDTVPAYYTPDYMLERIYTRQLVSYPSVPYSSTASAGWTTDTTPVADAATVVPTTANGGITGGGKVYTFHIKPGVDWDTTPARQVTADDFVREFKTFFNPVSPVGNADYYTSTIAGMQQYDNEETAYFANAKAHPATAANIANFQNTHTISGIKAINSLTLQFTLNYPASDFLYMLAMPFASARPVEYDSYLPNSLQLDQNLISDGPYAVSSYVAGKSITFVQNPAWKQSTDTLRHRYVSKMVVTINGSSAQTQLADIQAGSQDVSNDENVNPASIPSLIAAHQPNFQIWPWSTTYPYLVFNTRSPNQGGAIQKLLVRQAMEYGVDKVAVAKSVGGPSIATVINTVIPPGNAGYVDYNLYPDNNGAGNVAACKADLAKAGFPHGISLTLLYLNDSPGTRTFEAVQASLAQCGITVNGKGEPGSTFFVDLGDAPENNKPGTFDMALANWVPDWFGNNGRTVIQALFGGPNCVINTVNYGCYDNATVNSLITQAEAAPSLAQAGAGWHAADEQIMKDAAVVPLISQNWAQISSKRVRGVLPNGKSYDTALWNPNLGEPDLGNIWLAGS
jgi:peptide/nickel transport system substrate-binding protein